MFLSGWAILATTAFFVEAITIFVSAGLIAFVLNYPVSKLAKISRLPRPVVAVAVYLLVGLGLVGIGITLLPPLIEQARQLVASLPALAESAKGQAIALQTWADARNIPINLDELVQQAGEQVESQAKAIASRGITLALDSFSRLVEIVFVLVISVYMLVEGSTLWVGLTQIVAPEIREELNESLQSNLRDFFVGQLVLGTFMTLALLPCFLWLKVPFALLLAAGIGVFELIPFIGATIGIGASALAIAALNWVLALKMLAVALVIQQIKDNLVAPRIFGNFTGLNPVLIFAALLVGAKVGGLLGVILAIPLAGVVKSIYEIVANPLLPPQTGSFFVNPVSETAASATSLPAKTPATLPDDRREGN